MPLSPDKTASIRQAKIDALCAKHLHERKFQWLRNADYTVDALVILVPPLYFAIRYLFKGNVYIEAAWEVLAAVLFALGALKLLGKWSQRAEAHSHLRRANASVIRESDFFLDPSTTTTNENADWFLKLVATRDEADGDLLIGVKPSEMQEAYRDALKKFHTDPAKALCPVCGANVWNYKKGSCQLCGGTPPPH